MNRSPHDSQRNGATGDNRPLLPLPVAPLQSERQDDTPNLRACLLGGFTLALGDQSLDASAWRLRKAQHLVKLLLLAPGRRLHRERVMELLWPDLSLDAAANNLHYTMHAARATLAPLCESLTPTILARPEFASRAQSGMGSLLRLRQQIVAFEPPSPYWIDVEAFEAAASAARGGSDPQRYEAAIALYGGELLPDDIYEDWAAPRRDSLRATHQALLLTLGQLYAAQGSPAAIGAFERVLATEPAHEEAHRSLMRLYAQIGRRHESLRQYERLCEALRRELDAQPGPESRTLYADILADRMIAVSPTPLPAASPPIIDSRHVTPPSNAAALSAPHPRALPALIGRQDALARIRDAWDSASAEPQAVFILGEAGIGKSRLAEEALVRAPHQSDNPGRPTGTAMARCYEAEGALPFAVAVSWLRSGALWPGLLTLDPVWLSEVARVVPEIMVEYPNLPLAPALPENMQRSRLFEALARAITQSGQSLLLLVDDLQWCEPETVAWLRYLLRFPTHAPLLVIGTARAEEIASDHPLITLMSDLHHTGQLTELALEPLDDAETAALGAQVAGRPLDTEQAKRLYAETEGHPLFAVELVRAGLVNPLAVSADVGSDSDSGAQRLPPTMLEVLARRLRQLSPVARDLANMASVVGREFTAELLLEVNRIAGKGEEPLLEALEELQRRRIVRELAMGRYDFSHDKFREVAYATLNAARRQALHRRVARALESLSADALEKVLPQLAMHYERGGETAKAVMALERAGRLATQRGLSPLARAYLQRAIDLAPQSDQRRLYEELGDSYVMPYGSFDVYRTALRLWRQQKLDEQDPLVGARLMRKILYVGLRSYVHPAPDPQEMAVMAVEAQQFAEQAGNESETLRTRIAGLCWQWSFPKPWGFSQEDDVALHMAAAEDVRGRREEVLAAADRLAALGERDAFQEVLDVYTGCLMDLQAFYDALEMIQRRARAPHISNLEQGDIVGMFAQVYTAIGDYEACIAAFREAWLRSRPDVPLLTGNSFFGSNAAWLSGAWDEMSFLMALNERLWEECDHFMFGPLLSFWGILVVGLAREDRAMIEAATAKLELLIPFSQAESQGFADAVVAMIAAFRADDPAPILLASRPLEWDVETSIFALIFFCERGLPSPDPILDAFRLFTEKLCYDSSMPMLHVAEAVASNDPALLEDAIEEVEAHKLIPHAARMRIVLAQWTGDRAHLERARPVLERLGDRQFLRRLEAVEATLP